MPTGMNAAAAITISTTRMTGGPVAAGERQHGVRKPVELVPQIGRVEREVEWHEREQDQGGGVESQPENQQRDLIAAAGGMEDVLIPGGERGAAGHGPRTWATT